MIIINDSQVLVCPQCDSGNLVKKGYTDVSRKQRYQCKNCGYKTCNPLELDRELLEENVRLAKRSQKFMDRNRIERKGFREFARIDNAVLAYNKALIDILKEQSLKIQTVEHENVQEKAAGVFHLSDVHFNELVHETYTLKNRYDFKIAAKRCKKFVDRAKMYFNVNNVGHVLLVLGGDLLNSDRRLDELLNMATNRAQATVLATQIISQMILDLNANYKVTVTCVSGNESRVKDIHEYSDIVATDNYDWTIFEILKMLFLTNGKKNNGIAFVKGGARETVVNVNGQNILCLHGDTVPKTGVEKKVMQIKGKWRDKGINVDFIIFGDLHSARIGDTYARSSSMVGANTYSDDALQLSGRASQNIHILYKSGNRDSLKIDLQDTTGIKGYDLAEELEAYNAKSALKTKKPTIIHKIVI